MAHVNCLGLDALPRMLARMLRSPSLPYVLPFAAYIALLAAMPLLPLAPRSELLVSIIAVGAVLVFFSRNAVDFAVSRSIASVAVGVAVFVVWIAPELLVPGYRQSILFDNALFAAASEAPFAPQAQADALALALRAIRATLLVPIVEELFWRAWLPRWLVRQDFRAVPLGTFTRVTFAATAILFAVEHGQYWDVGLVAGVIYNAWMWRTRSLGDCMLAHAVTNGCLAAYVVTTGQWQYW